jgi:hypothetical protein
VTHVPVPFGGGMAFTTRCTTTTLHTGGTEIFAVHGAKPRAIFLAASTSAESIVPKGAARSQALVGEPGGVPPEAPAALNETELLAYVPDTVEYCEE